MTGTLPITWSGPLSGTLSGTLVTRWATASLAGTRRTFRHKILNRIAVTIGNRQPLSNLRKNSAQFFLIHNSADGQRLTFAPGTSRPSDAMNIGVYRFGKVKIDDQPQTGHINPARSNICRYQHLQRARLEFPDDLLADILAHITMQRINADTLLAKPICKLVNAHPRAHKYQNLPVINRLQLAQQQVTLVDILCQHGTLAYRIHRLASILDLDCQRVAEKALGQCFHLGRHGGRKQHRLACLW